MSWVIQHGIATFSGKIPRRTSPDQHLAVAVCPDNIETVTVKQHLKCVQESAWNQKIHHQRIAVPGMQPLTIADRYRWATHLNPKSLRRMAVSNPATGWTKSSGRIILGTTVGLLRCVKLVDEQFNKIEDSIKTKLTSKVPLLEWYFQPPTQRWWANVGLHEMIHPSWVVQDRNDFASFF